jgi:hypothetical protein
LSHLYSHLHVLLPPDFLSHLPVDCEDWVLCEEDEEPLSVDLEQAVDVVQGHALVLDPVQAEEGKDLAEATGQSATNHNRG